MGEAAAVRTTVEGENFGGRADIASQCEEVIANNPKPAADFKAVSKRNGMLMAH